MRIRPAQPEDAEALATLQDAAWREGFRAIAGDPSALDRLRKAFTERLEQEDRPVVVAELDGEVRGFVSFGPSRDEGEEGGEVYGLYVDPGAWRQGTGRVLLERALAGLKESGFAEVTLWSFADNARACALYEASGFARDRGSRSRPEYGGALEVPFRRSL